MRYEVLKLTILNGVQNANFEEMECGAPDDYLGDLVAFDSVSAP